MLDFKNRLKGGIIGSCVGDALGVPVEFKSRPFLRENPVSDMTGYGTYRQPPGTWSDDSSMTFCTMESLCNGYDLDDIANNFSKWRYESFWTPFGIVFDIGISTTKAIIQYKNTNDPRKSGNNDERSNGNGSLMRILPLAFYLKDFPVEKRFEIISEVSSITHAHIRSVAACFIYVEMALQLINGMDKFSAYHETTLIAINYLKKIKINPSDFRQFEKVLNGQIQSLEVSSISSSGYVIDSLEASIWTLLTTNSYKDAVLKAVNLGGDTDTTAAVTGGLVGLHYGFESIPADWINKLARVKDVLNLTEKFYDAISN
ncbi:MAG: ADP-ribosylglycohydrolase family protein [Bacteroidales bacterium]|nr:ADP-ribosylglycohydrolase family protein [Bacteroidales bacterium]